MRSVKRTFRPDLESGSLEGETAMKVLAVAAHPDDIEFLSADMDAKRKMLSCHKSQEPWAIDMYGVTCIEMMESFSRMRGFQCGCAFAEGFRTPPMWPKTVDPAGLL
jgi:LmbE family N-acetylglucosaminyl deacetylase